MRRAELPCAAAQLAGFAVKSSLNDWKNANRPPAIRCGRIDLPNPAANSVNFIFIRAIRCRVRATF